MDTYDGVYAQPEFYWGREPNTLCRQVCAQWLPKRRSPTVVDLGCGEGRDVLQFARCGATVVGVDISPFGLDKMQQWAAEEGLRVDAICADLNTFHLTEPVDVVYSSGSLTYLSPERRRRICCPLPSPDPHRRRARRQRVCRQAVSRHVTGLGCCGTVLSVRRTLALLRRLGSPGVHRNDFRM